MDRIDDYQKLAAIGKELEKNLNNSEAWAAKADILCSMGMHEIAIRCCDRSLEINPDNMLTWMTKGIALEKIGKHEEAMAALAKAKELEGAELLDVVTGL
jgi:tetratricopeptide (TPR) repeat protein